MMKFDPLKQRLDELDGLRKSHLRLRPTDDEEIEERSKKPSPTNRNLLREMEASIPSDGKQGPGGEMSSFIHPEDLSHIPFEDRHHGIEDDVTADSDFGTSDYSGDEIFAGLAGQPTRIAAAEDPIQNGTQATRLRSPQISSSVQTSTTKPLILDSPGNKQVQFTNTDVNVMSVMPPGSTGKPPLAPYNPSLRNSNPQSPFHTNSTVHPASTPETYHHHHHHLQNIPFGQSPSSPTLESHPGPLNLALSSPGLSPIRNDITGLPMPPYVPLIASSKGKPLMAAPPQQNAHAQGCQQASLDDLSDDSHPSLMSYIQEQSSRLDSSNLQPIAELSDSGQAQDVSLLNSTLESMSYLPDISILSQPQPQLQSRAIESNVTRESNSQVKRSESGAVDGTEHWQQGFNNSVAHTNDTPSPLLSTHGTPNHQIRVTPIDGNSNGAPGAHRTGSENPTPITTPVNPSYTSTATKSLGSSSLSLGTLKPGAIFTIALDGNGTPVFVPVILGPLAPPSVLPSSGNRSRSNNQSNSTAAHSSRYPVFSDEDAMLRHSTVDQHSFTTSRHMPSTSPITPSSRRYDSRYTAAAPGDVYHTSSTNRDSSNPSNSNSTNSTAIKKDSKYWRQRLQSRALVSAFEYSKY